MLYLEAAKKLAFAVEQEPANQVSLYSYSGKINKSLESQAYFLHVICGFSNLISI